MHSTRFPATAAMLGAALTLAACGGMKSRASVSTMPQAAPAAAPLDQSLFSKDPRGALTEDGIQAILDRPLEIALPARVGVLPITPAADGYGPGLSQETPAAVSRFAENLRGSDPFTMVTGMMSIPSGALGMESLREVAARYKLRYVVLYRENVRKKRVTNAWSLGYATLIGALFLPGDTLELDGFVEASMFDVKTGLLMFTVRERLRASQLENPWHTDDKLQRLQRKLAIRAAEQLAADVRSNVHAFQAAVEAENEQRQAAADQTIPAGRADPEGQQTAAIPRPVVPAAKVAQ